MSTDDPSSQHRSAWLGANAPFAGQMLGIQLQRLAVTLVVQMALNNTYWKGLGLKSLKDRYKNCVLLDEAPDADPHVRWCERGRLVSAPYSILPRVR
jgi:hypothetical protein